MPVSNWPPFSHKGITYDFGHLADLEVHFVDSTSIERLILVTFHDHCVTRDPVAGDDPALRFPGCSRKPGPGMFCAERYEHSKGLRAHLAAVAGQKVWVLWDTNFAVIPCVTSKGKRVLYGIVFSLDKHTGDKYDLVLRVRSAYQCDEKKIETYGAVSFLTLVRLRLEGKQPRRIKDRNQKRPQLT